MTNTNTQAAPPAAVVGQGTLPPPVLTLEDAAGLLQLKIRTLYNYVRSGELKAMKFGHVWRIEPADLEDFKQRHMNRK